jgi:hypothetical protein
MILKRQGEETSEPLKAALYYVKRGIPVFPLHNLENGNCSCMNADCSKPAKHPRALYGIEDATVDENQIRTWWAQWPNANIGIPTGGITGLTAIEINSTEALSNVKTLCGEGYDFESVPRLRTGTGWQCIWKSDLPLKSCLSILDKVDSRGEGGYIVGAPIQDIDSQTYHWEVHLTEHVPNLPRQLRQLIFHHWKEREQQRIERCGGIQGVPETQRERLFQIVYRFRERDVPEAYVRRPILLPTKYGNPPFPEHEALEILRLVYEEYPPGNDLI